MTTLSRSRRRQLLADIRCSLKIHFTFTHRWRVAHCGRSYRNAQMAALTLSVNGATIRLPRAAAGGEWLVYFRFEAENDFAIVTLHEMLRR